LNQFNTVNRAGLAKVYSVQVLPGYFQVLSAYIWISFSNAGYDKNKHAGQSQLVRICIHLCLEKTTKTSVNTNLVNTNLISVLFAYTSTKRTSSELLIQCAEN